MLIIVGNPHFIHAIMRSKKRFEELRSFTLESGQEEMERLYQRRKDTAGASESTHSPARSTRNSSIDSARSPQSVRAPSLSNVPEEGGAFTIGGDDDSDDDEEQSTQNTPSQSSPSIQASRTPSAASSIDDAVPPQLRGMSEKARGKMPAGQLSFSRQSSMTSLNTHVTANLAPVTGFAPSAHWVSRPSPPI